MEMEDDKRDLISREISKFRDTHKVTHLNCSKRTPPHHHHHHHHHPAPHCSPSTPLPPPCDSPTLLTM